MKNWKATAVAFFVLLCVILNCFGKWVAESLGLPLWLDAFGTVLTACALGPACGAIVGFASNTIYGMYHTSALIYSLTSIVIGITVGVAAKRGCFESLFRTMSASVVVTLASVCVSVPVNLIFNSGMTGNIFGDGVIEYLYEKGLARFVCYFIGEFYIDFLDKVITLVCILALIRLYRMKKRKSEEKKQQAGPKAMLGFMLVLSLSAIFTRDAYCETGIKDFDSYVQTVYSTENGLPCGEANDIAQTKDGILWIGTYAGLYRYNGSEFRFMNYFESVRNVNCLYVDGEGRLWIGTNDRGVAICINETVVNVLDTMKGLPSDSIRSIVMGDDGTYYIGTSDSMQVVVLNGGLKMRNTIDEVKYAQSSCAGSDGYVAAVTAAGELFLLKEGQILDKRTNLSAQEAFMCCHFGRDGSLMAGTSAGGIHTYEIKDGKLLEVTHRFIDNSSMIRELYQDEEGGCYVCSDEGIGYVNPGGAFRKLNTGSFRNAIDHMLVDYQGNLWFTSSRLGLLCMSPASFSNMYKVSGLEEKVVNSVCEWRRLLYVGTDNGLDVISPERRTSVANPYTQELSDVRIRCVRADSKGNLWVCTFGKGLVRISHSGKIKYFDDLGSRVRLISELSTGEMVVSADKGIVWIDGDKVTGEIPYGDELGNALVLCLLELDDGRILAGTDGEGIAVIKDKKVERTLNRRDGLSSGVIMRMVKDGREGVFVVTSNGLNYSDLTVSSIRSLDNFPYYNNYDMEVMSDGRLFICSSAGLYVVGREDLLKDGEGMMTELLDSRRGLTASLTANAWNHRDDKGNIYLSTDKGVYKINVNDYQKTRSSYRMMVSTIKTDDVYRPVERGIPFEIGRNVARIEIFPEVINYAIEDPYVRYQLEGFDASPTTVLQSELSSIVYTNIPSGEYTFRLSVLDGKSDKIIESSAYNIIVAKEIYDNAWFPIYMVVVGMLAVSWLTWFVVRTQIQRTLEFQRKEIEFGREQIRMGNQTILAIAKTVDAKDGNTSMHSQRVSDYSVMLARELGFSEDECENLRKAALLHDIGKIAIPDRVLNKPGRLDDEEYATMKNHVKYGADILKDFTLVDHVEEGARYHHERYDGTGYLEGLKGEDIPLYGRIIAVADAFDAMTANRVYRKKQSFDYVLSEIEKGRGTQFDPEIADALLRLIDSGKIDVKALYATDPMNSAALVKVMAEAHRDRKEEDGTKKGKNSVKKSDEAGKRSDDGIKKTVEDKEDKA